MDAHRCEESDDPEDERVFLWARIDADDHMEEEDSGKKEVRDIFSLAIRSTIEELKDKAAINMI